MYLLQTFTQNLGVELIVSAIATIGTVITSYIIIRERIVKNELKIENIYEYINSRDQIRENEIKELKEDISDFKEINRETTKSLSENTAAIRELKFVLDILRDRLVND